MRKIEEHSIEVGEVKQLPCPGGARVIAARFWTHGPGYSYVELQILGDVSDRESLYYIAVTGKTLIQDNWVFVASTYDAGSRQTWFVFEVK